MAYFARTDVESFLNVTLTTPQGQNLVDMLIPALEARANRHCNRRWAVSGQQVETFDGGQQTYFPSISPIGSVASITVDGTTLSTSEYFVYSGYIRLDYPAIRGNRNVVITYTANVALPEDVKLALVQWAATIFKSAQDAGMLAKRVKFGQADVEYLLRDGMPQFVKDVLDSYRLPPV